jgi:hypothetical protein
MKVKNFDVLRKIIESCGEDVTDLAILLNYSELETQQLIQIKKIDESVDKLENLRLRNSEFNNLNIEGIRERNNEIISDLLTLSGSQIAKICEEYHLTTREMALIFQ